MTGMFDHLTQAAHISIGMRVPLDYALDLVREAEALREQEYRDSIAEIESNVVYGVNFMNRKPKGETLGKL